MRFDVASISKLFTSVAVLRSVAAGWLDLDASIHEYNDLNCTAIAPAASPTPLLGEFDRRARGLAATTLVI